ncbi:hypothetical protein SAMN05444411_11370 [Lutibacter oricola]|uniref:TonB protein C-terminal n=2 Tax=Lutibacter oricola TaxID=762486 RepID=A0A1H3G856_9FLAO|nr:hypothetical protein SAMN05444411_11370 [Lutibacter oricola]
MPIFPGCEESKTVKECFSASIAKHLVKNSDYVLANDEETEYYLENFEVTEISNEIKTKKIKCFFTIDYQGKAKKVRLQGNIDRGTRKKFKENLKKLPIMKPGTLKGKSVDIPFILPVFIKQF